MFCLNAVYQHDWVSSVCCFASQDQNAIYELPAIHHIRPRLKHGIGKAFQDHDVVVPEPRSASPVVARNPFDPQPRGMLIHLLSVLLSLHPMQSETHLMLLLYYICQLTFKTLDRPFHLLSVLQIECNVTRLYPVLQLLHQLIHIALPSRELLHACFE